MPPAFVLSQNQTLMFMINAQARGKSHPNTENLQEPFLHNIQVCLHIETVNDLALTELPAPEGRQNPEPPPTCPFIYSNNEKDHDTFPSPGFHPGVIVSPTRKGSSECPIEHPISPKRSPAKPPKWTGFSPCEPAPQGAVRCGEWPSIAHPPTRQRFV
jgi:hypothetical protein